MLFRSGVYKGHNKTTGVLPEELVENNIFTDLKTVQSLVPGHKGAEISKAWYFTSSPKLVNSVIKEAKKQDLPWKTLRIRNENEASKGVVSSLENVQQIITMFMIGMGITAILILSFVLIFWIRNRINEIGILVSVGISKANVMKQMIWELLMIGAAALGATFAMNKLIVHRTRRRDCRWSPWSKSIRRLRSRCRRLPLVAFGQWRRTCSKTEAAPHDRCTLCHIAAPFGRRMERSKKLYPESEQTERTEQTERETEALCRLDPRI